MKKISIIFGLMLLLLAGCATQPSNQETFTVGMECGYAPYNWTQPTAGTHGAVPIDGGQYCEGYDVQIAKRLADTMGKELVIQKTSWDGLIPSIQSNQIDAVIAGMTSTEERRKEMNFSNVYYLDKETYFGVVVESSNKYAQATGIDDFEGARISAQVGTFHTELMAQIPNTANQQAMKDFPTMTVALQSGELDAFVTDSSTGITIAANNPKLEYIQLDDPQRGFNVTDEMAGVSIGVNKDNPELLEEINEALTSIDSDTQRSLMDQAISAQEVSTGNFFEQVMTILKANYPALIHGTLVTLGISITATLIGFVIGLLVAIFRNNKVSNALATIYITIFRGTPMMVQALVFYYGIASLIPGFRWANIPYGNIIAGIIIVSVNTGAYMAETVRSGIQAIDPGQFEAAKSLGFTRWETMKYVILPQAIKNVIPAIGNELVVNVKDTSVLNVISVTELFFVSNSIAATTYQIFQTFAITTTIYLILTTLLSLILRFIELKLDKTKTTATSIPASITDAKHI